jgi:hypothetical protein
MSVKGEGNAASSWGLKTCLASNFSKVLFLPSLKTGLFLIFDFYGKSF